MGRIILVRHSTPAVDASAAPAEWRLSTEGRARAADLAGELRSLRPQAVLTSPERKARETAEVIVGTLGLASARIVPGLREHDNGGAPWMDHKAFQRSVADLFARPAERVFGAETADQAYERFAAALDALPRPGHGASTVVVSHGRVIALFVARQRSVDAYELWRRLTTPWFTVLDPEASA